MGYALDYRGSIHGRSKVVLLHSIQIGSGAHPAFYPMGVKRPGCEADHSPPSSTEVKNCGPIAPLPLTSSWRGASLIKHRDNLTFAVSYL
jgi:hypothetical protein